MIQYFKDYINGLNEGLIKTYPSNVVVSNITKDLNLLKLNTTVEYKNNKIELTIYNFNYIPLNQIKNIFDQIFITVVNNGGWFPSLMDMTKLSGMDKKDNYDFQKIIQIHDELDNITIYFEKKFDIEINDIPNKLYHLTIKEYLNKIIKFGLVPKSKSKLSSHLDRIYVCKTYQDCLDLIPKMMFYYTGEKDDNIYKLGKKLFGKDIEPIVLEIDNTDKIIDKLYIDTNYNNGYYILDNIKPDRIKVL